MNIIIALSQSRAAATVRICDWQRCPSQRLSIRDGLMTCLESKMMLDHKDAEGRKGHRQLGWTFNLQACFLFFSKERYRFCISPNLEIEHTLFLYSIKNASPIFFLTYLIYLHHFLLPVTTNTVCYMFFDLRSAHC